MAEATRRRTAPPGEKLDHPQPLAISEIRRFDSVCGALAGGTGRFRLVSSDGFPVSNRFELDFRGAEGTRAGISVMSLDVDEDSVEAIPMIIAESAHRAMAIICGAFDPLAGMDYISRSIQEVCRQDRLAADHAEDGYVGMILKESWSAAFSLSELPFPAIGQCSLTRNWNESPAGRIRFGKAVYWRANVTDDGQPEEEDELSADLSACTAAPELSAALRALARGKGLGCPEVVWAVRKANAVWIQAREAVLSGPWRERLREVAEAFERSEGVLPFGSDDPAQA